MALVFSKDINSATDYEEEIKFSMLLLFNFNVVFMPHHSPKNFI